MLASMASISYPGTQAEQLLLAPQELRTADPSFATELYNGHFGLAGRLAEVDDESPFEITPPSEAGRASFTDLAGSGICARPAASCRASRPRRWCRISSRSSARTMALPGSRRSSAAGSSPGSPIRCSSSTAASREAYANFLRALTSQLRYLSASYRDAPDGVPRLVALMALIYAGLCIAEQQAVVDRYSRPFGKELDRQILPDGGHISRNPEALVELLLDLLPLRQCFVARDRAPPKELTDAIDRIMPMLRFFRTGDGTLARFNGAGPRRPTRSPPCSPMTTSRARRSARRPNSGYVRLECGPTLLICDIGPAPALSVSTQRACGLPFLRDELRQLSDDRQLRRARRRPCRLDAVCPLDAGAFDAELRGILPRRSSPRPAPTAARSPPTRR